MRESMTENELQQIMPFTCTNSNCANRKACRIKNGELVTTPELNVRLKTSRLDERFMFLPIKGCDNIDEAITKARAELYEQNLVYVELYIDDKKIATIYG